EYLDSCIAHLFIKGFLQLPTTHVIKNHPYLDTFLDLSLEYLLYFSAQLVICKDVVFKVDKVLCIFYGFNNRSEGGRSVLQYFNFVSYGYDSIAIVKQEDRKSTRLNSSHVK